MSLNCGQGGKLCQTRMVPPLDILLVLPMTVKVKPHWQMGLQANQSQEAGSRVKVVPPEAIVVQIASDGSLRNSQSVVQREGLREWFEEANCALQALLSCWVSVPSSCR